MKLEKATRLAHDVLQCLDFYGAKSEIQIVGSVRRQMNYCRDIDIVARAHPTIISATQKALNQREIIMWNFGTIDNPKHRWGEKLRGFALADFPDVKIELFTYDQHNRGYITWLRTGPGDANRYVMQTIAYKKAPFKFADGYAWTHNGDRISIPTEQDLFSLIGLPYTIPERRTMGTYRMYFERPSHRFTVPQALVMPEPKQQSLF